MRNQIVIGVVGMTLVFQAGIEGQKGKIRSIPVEVTVQAEVGDGDPAVFFSNTAFAGEVAAALTTTSGQVCFATSAWENQEEPGEIDPAGLLPAECGVGTIGVTAFAGLLVGTESRRQMTIAWTDANGRSYRLQFGDAWSEPTPHYARALCSQATPTGTCDAAIVDTQEGVFPTDGSETPRVTGPLARLVLVSGKGAKGNRVLGIYRIPLAITVTPVQ